jgi:tetratricopeptide (TPR) repeat protein
MSKKKPPVKQPLPKQKAKVVKNDNQRPYRWLFEILGILILVFITYGNSIKNDYNLDDGYVVSLDKSNTLTEKGIKGIPEILTSNYNEGLGVTYGYRPLGKVTMAIEYSLWQNNPHISHFINILLYALNVYLLLIFFKKTAKIFRFENSAVLYSAIALFIVHPIHTEVVCSIKNREETLCFTFILAALVYFLKFFEEKRWKYLLPFPVFFLLGYLSKETALTAVGLLILIIFFTSIVLRESRSVELSFIKQPSIYVKAIGVFFAFTLFIMHDDVRPFVWIFFWFFFIRSVVMKKKWNVLLVNFSFILALIIISFMYDVKKVLSHGDVITAFEQNPYNFLMPQSSFLLAVQSLSFYVKKLLLPYPLLYYYGYNMMPIKSWNTFLPYAAILIIISLTAFVIYNIVKKRHLFAVFFILFFVVTIFPFSNFSPNYYATGIVGERLCYQASAAYCILLSMLFFKLSDITQNKFAIFNKSGFVFTVLLGAIFLCITINRNSNWKDKTTLFEHDIPFLSHSARANFLLASRYMIDVNSNPYLSPAEKMQMVNNARSLLHTALKVFPTYADAWTGLGMIHYQFLSDRDSAFICFSKVDTANRFIYARARELLGDVSYNDLKDKERAKTFYLQAFRRMPESNTLYEKITRILFENAQYDSILVFSENGIRNNLPVAYVDKADAYVNIGDTVTAIRYYQKAYSNGFNKPLMPEIVEYMRRNNRHI